MSGLGTYGAVYRAEQVGTEAQGPVALKLGMYAEDPRFEREAELLSRLHHPSVPRLLDEGHWRQPMGSVYPYLVMDWVEGEPLYGWARRHAASSRQVARLLAQLAGALAAVHAVGVHRDVKGDNVLVRLADQRALLMDFGSGHYPDARPLTPPPFPPGTPAYRSPEAWRFSLQPRQFPPVAYAPGPADDVFALGVTAYRLVTREYLPPAEPRQDEAGRWDLEEAEYRPPLELNPRVEPRLSALILRMLSLAPEARGTARELAEALEEVVERVGPKADQPLFTEDAQSPSDERHEETPFAALLGHALRLKLLGNKARLRPTKRRRRSRIRAPGSRGAHRHDSPERVESGEWTSRLRPLLVAIPLVLTVLLCIRWGETPRRLEEPVVAQLEESPHQSDAGSAGIGDTTTVTPGGSLPIPLSGHLIALDLPQKPLPGQIRSDGDGRCPQRIHVAINGGCWLDVNTDLDTCRDEGYVYKGRCYVPVFPTQRRPTSDP
ncbi:serine/threonine protein kinase [Hyalangium gracile]|uniref:serine/threonine protein kinase n=1 Tax=Hyalangium gracile TaxID=394092 RepID=UPI001CCC9431|nr:protein kinase [Hyalangium gracile]